jgi:hypothetical protein
VAKAADVDWGGYFLSIQKQCPWSTVAWAKGKIDIQPWQGRVLDLDVYRARVYVVKKLNKRRLKKLCAKLDEGECEWLWSYPGWGPYATAVPVLIQQRRSDLAKIRQQLNEVKTHRD